jgi:prophage regulatory protein
MKKSKKVAPTHEILDRLPAVLERVNISKTSMYSWMKSGDFPQPVRLGPRSVAWRRSDVDAWIESRINRVEGE